jgi:multidrug efflux system membrane fusion protein
MTNKKENLFNVFKRKILPPAVFCGIVLFVASCKSSAPAPAAPAVSVIKPLYQEMKESDEYAGHLESPNVVRLSARVSGIVMQTPFEEGALVQAGDLLFVIDERPFKADLVSKEADVSKAQAQVSVQEVQLKRLDSVKGTRAISAQDYDQAVAAVKQAQAELGIAKAALDISHLNLQWAEVRAPIAGRVGRKLVTEGNLVNGGAGQATQLTTITLIDPIYAYIKVPESTFLKYQMLAQQKNSTDAKTVVPCSVQLENEQTFKHDGTINFVDNHIDPNTGTIEMRGVIPNSDGSLTPGLFARMSIPVGDPYKTLLVPDLAVGSDQNSRFLLVLGKDNVVEAHTVKLGTLFGKLRAIADGITQNDLIIVNGLQGARPGTKVAPTEIALNPDGTLPTTTSQEPKK